MSRNNPNSIGYIPPTPFRDDSDIFVLPTDPQSEVAESFSSSSPPVSVESVHFDDNDLSRGLELIASVRRDMQLRRSELARRFRELLHSDAERDRPATDPSASTGRARSVPKSAPFESASKGPESAELSTDAGNDRLAALKAQLAARLQRVQKGTSDAAADGEAIQSEGPNE